MSTQDIIDSPSENLGFERFWTWIQLHPNCILRVVTDSAGLFDDDDFHWHFGVETEDSFLVQVIRGKRLVSELILRPSEVATVLGTASEHPDEFLFSLYDADRRLIAEFVLSHGLDDGPPPTPTPGRVVH